MLQQTVHQPVAASATFRDDVIIGRVIGSIPRQTTLKVHRLPAPRTTTALQSSVQLDTTFEQRLRIIGTKKDHGDGPSVQSISAALEKAALAEFEDNYSRVSDEDSESSLTDRIDALKKLAPRYSIPDDVLGSAISTVEDRIAELSEQTSSGASTPSFTPRRTPTEKFDNNDLNNLFAPLLED